MTVKDFKNASKAVNSVIMCLSASMIKTYNDNQEMFDGGWFSDGPFKKVTESCSTLGTLITDISNGVKSFADLRMPIYDENGKIYNPAASKEEYKDVTDCEFYIETIKNVAEFYICEIDTGVCPNGPGVEKCYELKLAVDGGK